jgi:iron complex transport system permease protein
MIKKRHTVWLIGGLALIVLLCADLFSGAGQFSWADRTVLLRLRIPRILTALLAGASLAAGGAQMQSIFRNPLADPHIMGISGGAGLGAAIATLLLGSRGGAVWGIAIFALAGAVLTSSLILFIARRIRSGGTLLLVGVMLGFIFSALVSILEYTANEEALKLYFGWAAGSFTGLRYGEIALMGGALLVGLILAFTGHKGLDLMLFGENYAELSGARSRGIRFRAVLSCCLMTSAVTAFCGPIGFVGIISPILTRRILGSARNLTVLPGCILLGGIISLVADILSNLSSSPLPVGSTMALIGIPVILLFLGRSSNDKKP